MQMQLEFKRQGVRGSGTDMAIDSTIFWSNEIEHLKTIVGYVNKAIDLPDCYMLFVLVIESIQGKQALMGMYYGVQYITMEW